MFQRAVQSKQIITLSTVLQIKSDWIWNKRQASFWLLSLLLLSHLIATPRYRDRLPASKLLCAPQLTHMEMKSRHVSFAFRERCVVRLKLHTRTAHSTVVQGSQFGAEGLPRRAGRKGWCTAAAAAAEATLALHQGVIPPQPP